MRSYDVEVVIIAGVFALLDGKNAVELRMEEN
jgi:hypothetical protein